MKKVVTGNDLQEKIIESVDYLTNIVKMTLGPQGNNVIIDHSLFSPFVTNDGATIAQNIESEDAVINTILEITKEAALKTDEIVGDGTTTTLVLLQSLIKSCLDLIKNGKNPMILKKDLNCYLHEIIKKLELEKIKPKKEHLCSIATIAAKDEKIGKVVSQAFSKVKSKTAITIKEVPEDILEIHFQKGYQFDLKLASDYFLKDQKKLTITNAQILLIHDLSNDLDTLYPIFSDCIKNQKSLIILANNFDDFLVKEIISLNLDQQFTCILGKILDYGTNERKIVKDIEILTDASLALDSQNITYENMGYIKEINLTNDYGIINFELTPKIKKYFSSIKEESIDLKNDFEIDFYQKRIAMFQNGLAEILVGAPTKTECHEKKMRIMDALGATDSASKGILLGGGVTLLKIAHELSTENPIRAIFKKTLESPFKQILINSGIDESLILKEIENKNFEIVYNVTLEQLERKEITSVWDSFKVVLESLINATSIATMLFTTTSLVINEQEHTLNKTNEYTEI